MSIVQTDTATGNATRHIGLLELLRQEWIRLPTDVMRNSGPAAQTFGGILAITNRATFVSAERISMAARLPLPTVRKHLLRLEQDGWLANEGRQPTRSGRPRRTCTLTLSADGRRVAKESTYGVLPWLVCCKRRGVMLPWSARAVMSVIMARLMSLVATVERLDGKGDTDPDHLWGSIDNIGSGFGFSLERLAHETGLGRHAIIAAKQTLAEIGMVLWQWDTAPDGARLADELRPNPEFCFRVTPAKQEGRCHVQF